MTVRSGPFSELENACSSEISNHFPNWKGTAHPGPFFELKNDCPINNTLVLPPNLGVISSFFNKEVVSTSSSLSTQTLSSWTRGFTKMSSYLLICGYIYYKNHFLFSGLHHGECNALLSIILRSFWNTGFLLRLHIALFNIVYHY
jgi:hypothetical protein